MIDYRSMKDLQSGLGERVRTVIDIGNEELKFSLLSDPEVPDGPIVALVSDSKGRPRAVVLCSAPVAPDMVERALTRAREAKALLGPAVGAPILEPMASGRIGPLSYAVLPYCRPLTDVRVLWWPQRARLRPALLDWLWQVTKRSVCEPPEDEIDRRFFEPLRQVVGSPISSDRLRSAGKHALSRLDSGAWVPKHVLMHGDLWKGNILFRPAGTHALQSGAAPFVVIDWPGAVMRGYGIYDLVRLAQSIRLSNRSLRPEVIRHCAVLQCQPIDARCQVLAALGHLAQHRESFPGAMYARMAERCLTTIERAT